MKIIVNASGYVGQASGAGGAGVFLQYLVSELAKSHQIDILVAPNSKGFQYKMAGVRLIELPYLTAETLRHLRDGPTAVIDPFGAVPCLPFPEDMGLCIIIHDLMHLERPQFFTQSEGVGRSLSFAAGVQRADAVVTFSADQARATRRFFPGSSPVVISHLPYAVLRNKAAREAEVELSEYKPFALLPAVKWPHKNHRTAIEAFGAYVRKTGSNLRLVMCGGPCAESRFSFFPDDSTISSQVIDLGLVSEAMLRSLFTQASAILFPTLYEGFGIPVLEGAYLGKMVVASRLDIFDEILGTTGYRAIEVPECQLRWMDAFADIESDVRDDFELRTRLIREKVDPERFISNFNAVLASIAERYTHPAFYPLKAFPSGDRLTSSVVSSLGFSDLYGTATAERGPRQAGLDNRAATSTIFLSSSASPELRVCLRAQYELPQPAEDRTALVFSAWMRLATTTSIDGLRWSVNDGYVSELLGELGDGDWHLVRRDVPRVGYVDIRAVRDDMSEAPGFDLEIHDACIVAVAPMPVPEGDPPASGLTVVVTATAPHDSLAATIENAKLINAALKWSSRRLNWVIVTTTAGLGTVTGDALPVNLRVQILDGTVEADALIRAEPNGRAGRRQRHAQMAEQGNGAAQHGILTISPPERPLAARLFSPYQPIDQLLLLEAADLKLCLEPDNLEILAAALGIGRGMSPQQLRLNTPAEFWDVEERGRLIDAASRTGQPIPVLDREVIRGLLESTTEKPLPRFAVIETDLTSSLSHHSVVTGLFLDGAEACGFQPVIGINRSAKLKEDDGQKIWTGFSSQVYAPGSADDFTDELTAFVAAEKLGPDDVIFMHSLSPQIVLGAARFVAMAGAASPRLLMRFFSTAEAMAGHKLSYTKILKSIVSVAAVRERMQFFSESENLVDYYERAVGVRFPQLFNPEHPSLAAVRRSDWFDPGLGGGKAPTLAYFGEARAEKGFDFLPGILADLLANPEMDAFQFVIQTGSNAGNQTPEMAKAKEAIFELRSKYRSRIRTFESAETPEAFYFMMKHACGIIAPYRPDSYGIRGTGVTLEALQMGLDVFAWEETDLYATFKHTGRLVGVPATESFADIIARHYTTPSAATDGDVEGLRQSPDAVCQRMLALCRMSSHIEAPQPPILWVGNDTFGEGCSAVYAAQKQALGAIGQDCLELFVPWPDWNWHGQPAGAYDEKIYGFDSPYEGTGLAWVARPDYSAALRAILDTIDQSGPTFARLRELNRHMLVPPSLVKALQTIPVEQTLLNYVHLYPVIEGHVPLERIVCETHDIVSYQHAVRRGDAVSLTEKIDEFSDMSRFSQIVAISAAEQREMARACPASDVLWRLPPYIPEPPADVPTTTKLVLQISGGLEKVARPSPKMLSVYRARPDLQKHFELDTSEGRQAFFEWWVFFGQFETGDFGITKAQYAWLVDAPAEEDGPRQPCGLYRLMLNRRSDLMTAFGRPEGILIEELDAWASAHAEREFGVSLEHLRAAGERHFSRVYTRDFDLTVSALDAVADANPLATGLSEEQLLAFFQRIDELRQIDMVLVGSGHPANIESFDWFINQVFLPHLAPAGRNLFIVGSACQQLQHHNHRNLMMLGRCERIEPLLRAAVACPLPVISGSGSPIKTIPALAVNGAVTVSQHIADAFGFAGYGIPAFASPKAFATDLQALLTDDGFRLERVQASRKYVEDRLTLEGYVDFWRQRFQPE